MDSWQPLRAHASTKKFFKGEYGGKPALMIEFEGGAEERDRFSVLTGVLLKNHIPAPPIYFQPPGEEPYVITKFIEGTLFSSVTRPGPLMEEIFNVAGAFSGIAPDQFPEGFGVNRLGIERLRYEMDFFFLNFVGSFLGESPDPRVKDDIYQLAEEVSLFDTAFAHRDYHSENIMVEKERIAVLDYQDALFAPRAYDLASLLVDGYREMRRHETNDLHKHASSKGITETELRKTALQRALKALGTFGYQVVYRKKAKYFAAMARTSRYLRNIVAEDSVKEGRTRDFLLAIEKNLT